MDENAKEWDVILNAAIGRAVRLIRSLIGSTRTIGPLAAAPPVAAATVREGLAPPTQATPAPPTQAAPADWRADPQWVARAVSANARSRLPWGVAPLVGALRDRPAALRGAVASVLRDGPSRDVARCLDLDARGAAGRRAPEEDQRAAQLEEGARRCTRPGLGRAG